MSVFRVNLNNINQGQLDLDPTTNSSDTYGQLGEAFGTHQTNSGDYSLQRQVYVMGPNKINRLLVDGATFSDCNYWKKFAVPQTTDEFAFIEIVTDDGSVYSDIPEENTFAVGGTFTTATAFNTTNLIDFIATHGGPAVFLQVRNNDGSDDVIGELNGDANVTFTLGPGEVQVFNANDLAITLIRLRSSANTPEAEVLASVRSVCSS